MFSVFRLCVVLSILIGSSEPYNILVVFPFPIKSLNILGDGIVRHLLDAGHEVTYITVHPIDWGSEKRIRQILISDTASVPENDDNMRLEYIMQNSNPNHDRLYYQTWGIVLGNLTFNNENVTAFLEETSNSFDAVIIDFYENDAFAGLSTVFGCPLIWSFSTTANWLALRLVDESSNPAYTVDHISSNVPPLSFRDRVEELWIQVIWHYYKWFITLPKEKELYDNYFAKFIKKRGRTPPLYDDIRFNASFILCNDFNIDGRVPSTPQNFKLIAGQHMNLQTKALPKNLQTIMDNAEHGVVYFSLGSNWKAKYFPPALLRGLLETFGQLKQTVIWKFEESLTDVPKNVHIVKWAPQQSILAHPKLAVFISHGGQLSAIEVLHFGVPMIGVPISFDQINNIKRAVASGYSIEVELNYDLPKNLKKALDSMLSTDRYRIKAKEASRLYHDRLVPPGKELVFWVEHVARTRGALHLRSPALHVPFYQKLFLDLIVLVLLALATIIIIIRIVLSLYSNRITRSKKNN